ncbi:MAG TPA: hypothetical protein VNA88_17005, partial [Candidatus Kapabacteria bacterium]|nr:hypothetical protein [Candidatus Kapabacteria bacterium]
MKFHGGTHVEPLPPRAVSEATGEVPAGAVPPDEVPAGAVPVGAGGRESTRTVVPVPLQAASERVRTRRQMVDRDSPFTLTGLVHGERRIGKIGGAAEAGKDDGGEG